MLLNCCMPSAAACQHEAAIACNAGMRFVLSLVEWMRNARIQWHLRCQPGKARVPRTAGASLPAYAPDAACRAMQNMHCVTDTRACQPQQTCSCPTAARSHCHERLPESSRCRTAGIAEAISTRSAMCLPLKRRGTRGIRIPKSNDATSSAAIAPGPNRRDAGWGLAAVKHSKKRVSNMQCTR